MGVDLDMIELTVLIKHGEVGKGRGVSQNERRFAAGLEPGVGYVELTHIHRAFQIQDLVTQGMIQNLHDGNGFNIDLGILVLGGNGKHSQQQEYQYNEYDRPFHSTSNHSKNPFIFKSFLSDRGQHYCFDRVLSVLRFVPYLRCGTLDDLEGDFIALHGGQTVHKDRVALARRGHHPLINLVGA